MVGASVTGPTDFIPDDCATCLAHWFDAPHLVGAFSSVGIEHGKSSWQMAVEYFAHMHKSHV